MRKLNQNTRLGAVSPKLIAACLASLLLAGCSDSIERFSANYSNPSDEDPVYTASIRKFKPHYHAPSYQTPQGDASASDPIVQSPLAGAPLAKAPNYDYNAAYARTYRQPQIASQAPTLPTPDYAPPKVTYSAPQVAAVETPVLETPKPSYSSPVIQSEQVADASTDAPASKSLTLHRKKPGAKLTVAEGMSFYAIAKANHLTVKQLADANGISAPFKAAPGRVLTIPGTDHAILPLVAEAPIAPVQATAPQVAANSAVKNYTVASGDTLFSLGRKFGISPFAIADANGLKKDKALTVGKNIKIPTRDSLTATAKPTAPAVSEDVAKSDVAPVKPGTPLALPKQDIAQAEPVAPAAQVSAKSAATPSDNQLAMRWPVQGKVISAFGSKPNGLKNEGINIAVPEGTSVKAAETGVVAYAGNELKGYGNLILIRHANGYVTAYAHTKEILVKKGDQVKRGDVIAKSGQTGAVQSPQLHFEIRKGATPMDPTTFLNSATALN